MAGLISPAKAATSQWRRPQGKRAKSSISYASDGITFLPSDCCLVQAWKTFMMPFAASNFRNRFDQKGRLTPYMKSIPTHLLLYPAPALLGLLHEPAQHHIY